MSSTSNPSATDRRGAWPPQGGRDDPADEAEMGGVEDFQQIGRNGRILFDQLDDLTQGTVRVAQGGDDLLDDNR